MPGDEAALLDLTDEVEQLLRAAHREGGDDHVAAAVKRLLDARRKLLHIIHALFGVEPVAVSRFDDKVLGILNILRIAQDRLIQVSDVAREGDLARLSPLVQPDLDRCGSEQMPHVGHADRHAVVDLDLLTVGAGAQKPDNAQSILHVVERLDRLTAAALRLAALPLRFRHLDICTVTKHDVAERTGGGTGIDRTAVPLLIQQRQATAVVDMGVGEQHEIQLRRADRQLLIHEEILALLHAVVHYSLLIAHLKEGATAGNLMCCAEKRDPH